MTYYDWSTLNTHAPNSLQLIPLDVVEPSAENVRLFVEREPLGPLVSIYEADQRGEDVILPDPPILRFRGWLDDERYAHMRAPPIIPKLEILAGERRITAATLAKKVMLACRVVTLSDEEAYRFILAHNDVKGLTTIELAFRAAEMDRLGFSHEEISRDVLKGGSPHRYVTVGNRVHLDWITDTEKLCDPSIVEWYEAAEFGKDHFKRCFEMWDRGLWDEKQCAKHFRKRGEALPLDNAERGFRVTRDGDKLIVRGQVDLSLVGVDMAQSILDSLANTLVDASNHLGAHDHFGERDVKLLNPLTCGW